MNGPEKLFQDKVRTIAVMNGWMCFHPSPSQVRPGVWRTDGNGFPDLTLAHPDRGLIFAELKLDINSSKVSHEQQRWLSSIAPHAECFVWRPNDLDAIAERLGRKAKC